MSEIKLPPGTAPVKPEYLLTVQRPEVQVDDDAAEGSTNRDQKDSPAVDDATEDAPPAKKQKLNGAQRRRLVKEEKAKKKGMNTGRRFAKVKDDLDLCWKVARGEPCEFGDQCRASHDAAAYLAVKPQDIYFPPSKALSGEAPFVRDHDDAGVPIASSPCPLFAETGACRFALRCRFLSSHSTSDEQKKKTRLISSTELNAVPLEATRLLRSKKYPLPITNAYLEEIKENNENAVPKSAQTKVVVNEDGTVTVLEPDQDAEESIPAPALVVEPKPAAPTDPSAELVAQQADAPDVPFRPSEKKRLHWTGKTYLAPLTTVGNLPFRRLCVSYGADITCGEMGLATSFLTGSKEEWSLVRRHPEEQIFGIQLAGNRPQNMVAAAEVIGREMGSGIDFVDINCGCPIDLVFKQGSGSALLDAPSKLGKIVIGMQKALGDIPVTLKLRTGVKDGKNTAHKLMSRLATEFHASALTLHGRSRQQRYTKLADWDYIKQCTEEVRRRVEEEDLPTIPIFGGGDCYSSQDYWSSVEKSGVDGVMIGRGALIKPWIFTEIKERREWDISARERLDLIRKFVDFGLNHFGSDTAGVNTTRRYLCESLSFQYRYVPLGILEVQPGRLNDRAPAFRGRNELETLLASGNSRDWVKISEMFLGPPPEAWTFTPKHKSNAWSEESQG